MSNPEGPRLAEFFYHPAFLLVAALAALFFGAYGLLMEVVGQRWGPLNKRKNLEEALGPLKLLEQDKKLEIATELLKPTCYEQAFDWTRLAFQFWFNAVGGFAGWVAVWVLLESRFAEYGWRHLVAFLVAFTGITGNLPYFSYGLRERLAGVFDLVKRSLGLGG